MRSAAGSDSLQQYYPAMMNESVNDEHHAFNDPTTTQFSQTNASWSDKDDDSVDERSVHEVSN